MSDFGKSLSSKFRDYFAMLKPDFAMLKPDAS
jgi:hypothetical protein